MQAFFNAGSQSSEDGDSPTTDSAMGAASHVENDDKGPSGNLKRAVQEFAQFEATSEQFGGWNCMEVLKKPETDLRKSEVVDSLGMRVKNDDKGPTGNLKGTVQDSAQFEAWIWKFGLKSATATNPTWGCTGTGVNKKPTRV